MDFRWWEDVNEDQLVDDYLMYLNDMTREEDADRIKSVAGYWQFARGAYHIDLENQEDGDTPQYRWKREPGKVGNRRRSSSRSGSEQAD